MALPPHPMVELGAENSIAALKHQKKILLATLQLVEKCQV
jgi:hypothetical protein